MSVLEGAKFFLISYLLQFEEILMIHYIGCNYIDCFFLSNGLESLFLEMEFLLKVSYQETIFLDGSGTV